MRLRFVLAALAAVPSILAAQRSEGIPLRSGDLERLNPGKVVIDRRAELALEKPQLDSLESLRKAFDAEARRLSDEVRRNQRAITTAPPLLRHRPDARPETLRDSLERARLDSTNRDKRDRYFETVTAGRRDLAVALLSLKELFDLHSTTAVQSLAEGQRTGALLALEAASEEFTRSLRLANIR